MAKKKGGKKKAGAKKKGGKKKSAKKARPLLKKAADVGRIDPSSE